MCTPIIAIAAVAASVVSTVSSANAQRAAANSQAQQIIYTAQNDQAVSNWNAQATENVSTYNAQVAENNAVVYEQAAFDAVQRGADAAADERLASRISTARGRATAGSSGTVADAGTNLDLYVMNRQIGEMNALRTMNNAEREAYGYRLDANSERARAKGIKYTGDIEAENLRLGGRVGLLNAEYGAANTRYAGNLNARSTLIGGFADTLRTGYGFSQDLFDRNSLRRK